MLNALSVMAAHDRSAEMRKVAARRRLARLAACCRRGQPSRALGRFRAALADRAQLAQARPGAVCCA
jgi:hypothetical protein